MDALAPFEAEWCAGLDLHERIDLLRRSGGAGRAPATDAGLADWRMGEWRRQLPSNGGGDLHGGMLEALGVDEPGLRELLGAPSHTLREWCGDAPAWVEALERILARPGASLPWVGGAPGHRQMLEVFSPFLLDAFERLEQAAARAAGGRVGVPFAPGAVRDLFVRGLLAQVLGVASRVLTLELHVARLQGALAGETAEERFGSFVERLRRPGELAALLKGYPTLARTLVRMTDQWVRASAEILEHLCEDEAALRERFSGGEPLGVLTGVEGGVGDSHRGGRSVALLDFSGGLRLVHKPRPLAVDEAFHGLLRWLEGAGAGLSFRTPATLCRGGYGWVEFVRAAPCAGRGEVELYYRRLGGLLAVLHVLDGQDMHMENVVAAGPHPVLVDLETLFHPTSDEMVRLDGDDYGEPACEAGGPLEPPRVMARSVFKVGLLPQRIWVEDEGAGIDLSAVGGVGSQVAPGRSLHLENAGSDEMRLARAQVVLGASNNQPALAGEAVAQTEYADAMDRGFTAAYRTLAAHAAELTMDGVLAPFRDLPLRVVIRMTRTYASLLREGSHPDLLRDATDRDRFFDHLWRAAADRPELAKVIPFEQRALRRGDVPMFFAAPASRDLLSEDGAVLPGFFATSGGERVAERVAALGEEDLARQRLFVRASMATLAADPLVPPQPPSPRFELPGCPAFPEPRTLAGPVRERLVEAARAVGECLAATALRGPRKASWINLTTDNGRHSVAGFARYDLHGGLPGILLFLARLDEVGGAAETEALARGAFSLLRDLLHDGDVTLEDVGGFSGLGGALTSFGAVRGRWPGLPVDRLAERGAARIAEVAERQRQCGLFGGLAGAVAGLLSYHAWSGADAALETALRCGDRLLARAERVDGRPDWPSPHEAPPHATGFAFGTAGIAWALLRLAGAAGEDRFRAPALEALGAAWSRYQAHDRTPAAAATWCYGAPGMALALLEGVRHDAALGGALEAAVAETLRSLDGGASHALCNGTLGALDVLLQARPALGREVETRTLALLDEAAAGGWRCGAPLGMQPPGLMNGLAGIGHGLLRLAHPERVPSALTLGL
jgi:type 2 lantibiotic biosynthesis protein LanM